MLLYNQRCLALVQSVNRFEQNCCQIQRETLVRLNTSLLNTSPAKHWLSTVNLSSTHGLTIKVSSSTQSACINLSKGQAFIHSPHDLEFNSKHLQHPHWTHSPCSLVHFHIYIHQVHVHINIHKINKCDKKYDSVNLCECIWFSVIRGGILWDDGTEGQNHCCTSDHTALHTQLYTSVQNILQAHCKPCTLWKQKSVWFLICNV